MKKFIKDGKVGVVISLGYGAGWSSWSYDYREELCMDSNIVEAVLNGELEKARDYVEETYPDAYTGGYSQLVVKWVPEGMSFEINEFDGHETLCTLGYQTYMVA